MILFLVPIILPLILLPGLCMDCAWVVGLRKDYKIALGLGRLGLLEGAGKAALLLSSMTLHDLCSLSPCTVPHHAFLNPIALLVSLSVLDALPDSGAIAETGRNGRTVGPRTPSWFYILRHNRSSIAIGF